LSSNPFGFFERPHAAEPEKPFEKRHQLLDIKIGRFA
jgi:hypothetical protein